MNLACAFFSVLFFNFFCSCVLASEEIQTLEESFCADGTEQQLIEFFTDQEYVVFAQAKRVGDGGAIQAYSDVLFLVSPDLEFFHLVTKQKTDDSKFKACIYSSAREVDYHFAAPLPDLFPVKKREHLMFLDMIPKNGVCPSDQSNCVPWPKWSHMVKQTFLFSAYLYSAKWKYDAYEEIVELTVEDKTIRPTSGALAELARTKYAARLRNELNEDESDRKAAKKAYAEIYKESDHGLPLVMLMLTDNRRWAITVIDRKQGLVTTLMQGRDLELYPLPRKVYEKFLANAR